MQTKLTLRLDDALIRKARRWAQARGVTVSEVVASFFAQLPAADENGVQLSPWIQQLTGVGASATVPEDAQLAADYVDYLVSKCR